jgi:DNA-directed RNA polymerase subunit RPC12/RpoP
MICKFCGSQNRNHSSFCSTCGKNISSTEMPTVGRDSPVDCPNCNQAAFIMGQKCTVCGYRSFLTGSKNDVSNNPYVPAIFLFSVLIIGLIVFFLPELSEKFRSNKKTEQRSLVEQYDLDNQNNPTTRFDQSTYQELLTASISRNPNYDVVNQLSYCAASTLAQSIWNNQAGNFDIAETLQQGSFAYANLAVEYGQIKGMSKSSIIDLNKANDLKVRQEIKDGHFFNGALLTQKNNRCLNLIKNNATLFGMWKQQF